MYTSKLFPVHETDGKLGFLKTLAAFLNFFQFAKEFENWDSNKVGYKLQNVPVVALPAPKPTSYLAIPEKNKTGS